MNKKFFTASMAQAYEAGQKSAIKLYAKYGAIWMILALRREGFGTKRLVRVLEEFFRQIHLYVEGALDMDHLRSHVLTVTGIDFDFVDEHTDYVYTDNLIEEDFEDDV